MNQQNELGLTFSGMMFDFGDKGKRLIRHPIPNIPLAGGKYFGVYQTKQGDGISTHNSFCKPVSIFYLI